MPLPRKYAQKLQTIFLLIEDYGYSKSRTKIGVSVDIIKVWEKNSDSSQISQKLCGINLILHRYDIYERNRISMSDPITPIELHVGEW